MLFIQKKKFYHFKYSKIQDHHTISIFLDNNNLNFYFLYYDKNTKTYISKVLYSFDIGYSTEENLSILENINFYLTNTPSQFENDILEQLTSQHAGSLHSSIFHHDRSNSYIDSFDKVLKDFFDENQNIKNPLFKILFMSFIFELYQCDTFKKTKLYNHLKNNRIFKIFGAKLQYKLAKKIVNSESDESQEYLKGKEKRWINTLFDKKNRINLEYANGYELISTPEKELELILDHHRIKELDSKKDSDLILMSANYFLSTLNISKVFDIITRNRSFVILLLMSLSILTLIASLFFSHEEDQIPQGLLLSIFPIILAVITIFILIKRGLTYLSILIMPRLFFSILISWLALLTSYDLFYAHVHHTLFYFFIFNLLLLLIIYSYYHIKIHYKSFQKVFSILTVSIFISLVQGFFIIKFYLPSFICRAFTHENYINYYEIDENLTQTYGYQLEPRGASYELIVDLPSTTLPLPEFKTSFSSFFTIDVYLLFSLIILPVFFGLILQNIMDDKSIFKPLK